jgi:hypothetical protein
MYVIKHILRTANIYLLYRINQRYGEFTSDTLITVYTRYIAAETPISNPARRIPTTNHFAHHKPTKST